MGKFRVWIESKKRKDNPQQMTIDFDAEPEKPAFRPCSFITEYEDGGVIGVLRDINRQVIYKSHPYKTSEFRAGPDWSDEDVAASANSLDYKRWMMNLARAAAEEDAKKWAKENHWTISTF